MNKYLLLPIILILFSCVPDTNKAQDKYGAIDTNGNTVIPFIYDLINYPKEGLMCAKKDDHYGFLDSVGNVIIPFKYKYAYNFEEGIAFVEWKGKKGFINKKGDYC